MSDSTERTRFGAKRVGADEKTNRRVRSSTEKASKSEADEKTNRRVRSSAEKAHFAAKSEAEKRHFEVE